MTTDRNDEPLEVLAVDDDLDLESAVQDALGAVEADAAPEQTDKATEPEDPAAALERENRDLKEQVLRGLADLENYRKRMARERAEERRYSGQSVLRDFLDVKDNLGRALGSEGNLDDLKLGVEMTLRQFDQVLERAGVVEVEAVGLPFDPAVHDAVSRIESDEVDGPTVIEEMQRGYSMHDRLLRPARVVVAVPASSRDDSPGDDSSTSEE